MNQSKKNEERSPAPSDVPQDQQHTEQQEQKEGDFRNAEKESGRAGGFDDAFETKQEDALTTEEADTEGENR